MTIAAEIPVIGSIEDPGSRYSAWLVDIWGVMHNGHRAFPRAIAATRAFRARGGIVVLLSNSPRPSPSVQEQLRRLGVPDDAYDATVTSGDLTRHELDKHKGAIVFHLGPERDLPIFQGLAVKLGRPEQAELVVCSGLLDDETETPDDYIGLLRTLAARKLPMICANPDHLVERGDRLVYCAGALAALYEQEGGRVIYAGKPYQYRYCRRGEPRHRLRVRGEWAACAVKQRRRGGCGRARRTASCRTLRQCERAPAWRHARACVVGA